MTRLPRLPAGWDRLGLSAWYALVFLQPFNQFGGLRSLCMALLLVALGVTLWRNGRLDNRTLAPRIALALALWAIAVSLFGPYPLDSVHALSKDLLAQALMLIAALAYVRSANDAWRVVAAALAGFSALTLLALLEVGSHWSQHGFSLWVPRGHRSFWGGYATTGAFYIPLLCGWLLAAPKQRRWTIAGWAALLAAVSLVALYGSRTPLVVITVAVLVLLILLKQWRGLALAGLLAIVAAGTIQFAQLDHLDRYRTLFKSDTYTTNQGLSQRLSVWEGCWDVIAARPLTGYGYGWKKLAWAINDGNFAERWQNRPDITAYYLFDGKEASYGRVNPHSYPLQVMFETGIVGLFLALAFWLATIRESAVLLRRSAPELKGLAACLTAGLASYAAANLTNGLWVGGMANSALLLAGCLLALAAASRRPTQER